MAVANLAIRKSEAQSLLGQLTDSKENPNFDEKSYEAIANLKVNSREITKNTIIAGTDSVKATIDSWITQQGMVASDFEKTAVWLAEKGRQRIVSSEKYTKVETRQKVLETVVQTYIDSQTTAAFAARIGQKVPETAKSRATTIEEYISMTHGLLKTKISRVSKGKREVATQPLSGNTTQKQIAKLVENGIIEGTKKYGPVYRNRFDRELVETYFVRGMLIDKADKNGIYSAVVKEESKLERQAQISARLERALQSAKLNSNVARAYVAVDGLYRDMMEESQRIRKRDERTTEENRRLPIYGTMLSALDSYRRRMNKISKETNGKTIEENLELEATRKAAKRKTKPKRKPATASEAVPPAAKKFDPIVYIMPESAPSEYLPLSPEHISEPPLLLPSHDAESAVPEAPRQFSIESEIASIYQDFLQFLDNNKRSIVDAVRGKQLDERGNKIWAHSLRIYDQIRESDTESKRISSEFSAAVKEDLEFTKGMIRNQAKTGKNNSERFDSYREQWLPYVKRTAERLQELRQTGIAIDSDLENEVLYLSTITDETKYSEAENNFTGKIEPTDEHTGIAAEEAEPKVEAPAETVPPVASPEPTSTETGAPKEEPVAQPSEEVTKAEPAPKKELSPEDAEKLGRSHFESTGLARYLGQKREFRKEWITEYREKFESIRRAATETKNVSDFVSAYKEIVEIRETLKTANVELPKDLADWKIDWVEKQKVYVDLVTKVEERLLKMPTIEDHKEKSEFSDEDIVKAYKEQFATEASFNNSVAKELNVILDEKTKEKLEALAKIENAADVRAYKEKYIGIVPATQVTTAPSSAEVPTTTTTEPPAIVLSSVEDIDKLVALYKEKANTLFEYKPGAKMIERLLALGLIAHPEIGTGEWNDAAALYKEVRNLEKRIIEVDASKLPSEEKEKVAVFDARLLVTLKRSLDSAKKDLKISSESDYLGDNNAKYDYFKNAYHVDKIATIKSRSDEIGITKKLGQEYQNLLETLTGIKNGETFAEAVEKLFHEEPATPPTAPTGPAPPTPSPAAQTPSEEHMEKYIGAISYLEEVTLGARSDVAQKIFIGSQEHDKEWLVLEEAYVAAVQSRNELKELSGANASVNTLKSMKPKYAEDIEQYGIRTVDDLLRVNASELSTQTGIRSRKIEQWVEEAKSKINISMPNEISHKQTAIEAKWDAIVSNYAKVISDQIKSPTTTEAELDKKIEEYLKTTKLDVARAYDRAKTIYYHGARINPNVLTILENLVSIENKGDYKNMIAKLGTLPAPPIRPSPDRWYKRMWRNAKKRVNNINQRTGGRLGNAAMKGMLWSPLVAGGVYLIVGNAVEYMTGIDLPFVGPNRGVPDHPHPEIAQFEADRAADAKRIDALTKELQGLKDQPQVLPGYVPADHEHPKIDELTKQVEELSRRPPNVVYVNNTIGGIVDGPGNDTYTNVTATLSGGQNVGGGVGVGGAPPAVSPPPSGGSGAAAQSGSSSENYVVYWGNQFPGVSRTAGFGSLLAVPRSVISKGFSKISDTYRKVAG